MIVTLRKARNIEQEISTAFNAVDLQTEVSISMFEQEVQESYDSKSELAKGNVDYVEFLAEARFAIRELIAKENAKLGIDKLIVERKQKLDVSGKLNRVVGAEAHAPADVVEYHHAKVEKDAAEESKDRFGYRSAKTQNVSIPIYSPEEVVEVQAKLKALTKEISAIDDKLFELNATSKIEIEDSVIDRLEAEGVI